MPHGMDLHAAAFGRTGAEGKFRMPAMGIGLPGWQQPIDLWTWQGRRHARFTIGRSIRPAMQARAAAACRRGCVFEAMRWVLIIWVEGDQTAGGVIGWGSFGDRTGFESEGDERVDP